MLYFNIKWILEFSEFLYEALKMYIKCWPQNIQIKLKKEGEYLWTMNAFAKRFDFVCAIHTTNTTRSHIFEIETKKGRPTQKNSTKITHRLAICKRGSSPSREAEKKLEEDTWRRKRETKWMNICIDKKRSENWDAYQYYVNPQLEGKMNWDQEQNTIK